MDPQRISITIAARPHPGEPVVADAWQLAWHETTCRIALIHGVGEGLKAANSAATAARVMSDAPRLAPAQAIARCHEALRGTPGASILVAKIDAPGRRIAIAGAGGIAAKLCRDGECLDLPVNLGAVGGILGRVDAVDLEIGSDWRLLAHASDGGNGSPTPRAFPDSDAAETAAAALPAAGETVLVVRPR